ncbi:hypothetical protein EOK75_02265 [Pseudorhodobacter turbinis]|uniref:Uncharacterized protein n=1 Tax=Pseudorhodobacter turbinis TaxID=2500533 RepID=A0A4P8ED95_9RHOB|nr:hypothetical protein [Pseudorhodobacter turbinis]QCO54719.1 hypothetical protein EOK75_02265 [Pseudorhodobacter turbinis]
MLAPSKSAKRKAKQTTKAIGRSKKATLPAVKQLDSATRVKVKISATPHAKILGQRGSLKTGTHESVFGTRSYKLYVPSLAKVKN